VLLFQAPGEDSELKRILDKKRPIVFVGRVPSGLDADTVATDIAAGTQMGVKHLISKGHRRIGLVTVARSLSVASFRVEGWRAALKRGGIKPDPSLIVPGELAAESGYKAMNFLLDLPQPPTAVFADNLVDVTGILRALRQRALRCPDHVELVSSDDADWLDVFDPPITTVVQPSYELGVKSAELLLKRIKYPKRAAEMILLKPQLKTRP
jgi:LacI family transcriptional regulator